MAFDIRLYTFNKRSNSTATPLNYATTGELLSCTFLDAQSVMNPVIIIEDTKGIGVAMTEYSYAYIPSLNRLYFVSNVVIIDNNLYCYSLQVDVLGTYKDDFLSTSQYILRSTNLYNDYIIDTLYPTVPLDQEDRFALSNTVYNTVEAYDNKEATWTTIDFFREPYSNGAVLFGITGQGNVSVDYYVTTVSYFKDFIDNVVTATPTGQNWGNLPVGVQTTLSNFMQYITFAKWIPFMPLTSNIGSLVSSVYLGTQSINVIAYKVIAGNSIQNLRFSITIPNHPLINEHGYYNLNPYRETNFFFLPVGIIPIDNSKIWGENTLYVVMKVDLASANTEIIISTEFDDTTWLDHVLYSTVTDIGINLSLTEYSMSLEAAFTTGVASFLSKAIETMKGASTGGTVHQPATGITHTRNDLAIGNRVSSAYNGARNSLVGGSSWHTSSSGTTHGGASSLPLFGKTGSTTPIISPLSGNEIPSLSSLFAESVSQIGNALGPIGELLGTMADFFASSMGQVTTNGHTGSFLMYAATLPTIFCWFYKHGDEDYDRFGRPYCDTASLSTVNGFCLCKNAYVPRWLLAPLKEEREAIENCLNTGIYIHNLY